MKTRIRVESFEDRMERSLARARKLDRGEPVVAERVISFENPLDLLDCLTRDRIRLCEVAREEPRSVSDLALALGRNRRAVTRDVKLLHEMGLIRLRKRVNPGHGQVTLVEPVAKRFDLRASI